MDGVVYGAVDLPGLIQWIRDERVTAEQWVFAEHDNRWQKAADWPELQATLRSKPKGGVTGAAAVGKGGHAAAEEGAHDRRQKIPRIRPGVESVAVIVRFIGAVSGDAEAQVVNARA